MARLREEQYPNELQDCSRKAYVEHEDPFSAAYGNWGRWQTICFFLVGLAAIICTYPTLIMTFMNAKVDFWCRRPQNLRDLDIKEWRALSGGSEKNCQIFNLSYLEMTLDEAKRYGCARVSRFLGSRTDFLFVFDSILDVRFSD